MTGWQKFTVLMVGLICIAVICYYFEQAAESPDAHSAGLTVQQTGAADLPVQAQPVSSSGSAGSSDSQRERIAMADLVAQFTDLYEQPQRDEPQPQDDFADAADDWQRSNARLADRDARPDRPTWETTPGSLGPAAAVVSINNPGSSAAYDPARTGPAEQSPAATDPTLAAYDPQDADHPYPELEESPFETVVTPSTTIALEAAPNPAAPDLAQVQPKVLTLTGSAATETRPTATLAAVTSSAAGASGSQSSPLGISDYGAGNRQTVMTSGPPQHPQTTTPKPVTTTTATQSTSTWQRTLVEPDPLPVRTTRETPNSSSRRRTYTVQSGDTFSSIAVTVFGTERRYIDIVNANPDIDPRKLKVGQVINLPRNGAQPQIVAAVTRPAPAASGRYHVIGVGDNLSNIAARYYNDASKWQMLYKANRELIGPNPNRLKAGSRLTIPSL